MIQRFLQKQHLVCVASQRERALDEAINDEVHDLPGAIRTAAAARYLEQRTAAHEALRSHRVMVLESPPRSCRRRWWSVIWRSSGMDCCSP